MGLRWLLDNTDCYTVCTQYPKYTQDNAQDTQHMIGNPHPNSILVDTIEHTGYLKFNIHQLTLLKILAMEYCIALK